MAAWLDDDLEYFEEHRDELIKRYGYGRFITIYKGEVVSTGDTRTECVRRAIEKIGRVPCITRRLVPRELEAYEMY